LEKSAIGYVMIKFMYFLIPTRVKQIVLICSLYCASEKNAKYIFSVSSGNFTFGLMPFLKSESMVDKDRICFSLEILE
jgi:hypothetical protein